MLDGCDPAREIGAAGCVKECLRLLLGGCEPSKIRRRLADLYNAAIDAATPETTRLAQTIQTWCRPSSLRSPKGDQRPHRRVRSDHQTGPRVGCGYHNLVNHELRPQPYRGHPTAEISSMKGNTRSALVAID
jgi:hypothetical protein